MNYSPNALLDHVITKHQLKNDAALARFLGVQPPLISKIRHNKLDIGANLLLLISDVTQTSVDELRVILGDRRAKWRISDVKVAFRGKP